MADSFNIDWSNLGPSWSAGASNQNSNSVSDSVNYSSGSSWSGLTKEGKEALNPLLGTGQGSMPSMIDAWTNDLVKNYRVTADDTIRALNAVANKRAEQGILGGTEAQNLRGNVLSNMAMAKQDLANQAGLNAINLKTGVIPTLIGLTQESQGSQSGGGQSSSKSVSTGTSNQYSTSPTDYQIIADILAGGYTG